MVKVNESFMTSIHAWESSRIIVFVFVKLFPNPKIDFPLKILWACVIKIFSPDKNSLGISLLLSITQNGIRIFQLPNKPV